MAQEDLHPEEIEVIAANDNALLDWEVWAEVDDTSAGVFRAVEFSAPNILDKILWRVSNPGDEINRLDQLRANDNEIKKAA